jgi:aspartyl-tRNA(Asn)/glutamyl-tRNA(Gln) amidotransferase subunit A
MNEICDLPLDRLSRLLRRGALSPSEVVEAYLARIEALEGTLNAYITMTADQARAAARASEQRRSGAALGPLDGVPLALKDLIDVADVATTNGMGALRHAVASEDAEVTRRLKAAGAVLLGKLNMHEGALGMTTDNMHFGKCRNPWNTAATPGGSSGGSGAAVSAGLTAGALGSDNMGSIRIPSAFCGIAGLKPSHGLVGTRGMVELSWSTGVVGPMARGVDGLAILMSVLAGPDPRDPWARRTPEALDFTLPEAPELTGLKIGVPEDFACTPAPETARAFERAAAVLGELGAEIRPLALEGLTASRMTCLLIIEAEGAVAYARYLDDPTVVFAAEVRQQLDYGRDLSAAKLVGALKARALLRRRVEALFQEVDLLISPTTPRAALSFDEAVPATTPGYMALANLCGLPALSVPMGFDADGLPLGLQLMAAPFRDPLVLRAGKAYERATDWHERRPGPVAAT